MLKEIPYYLIERVKQIGYKEIDKQNTIKKRWSNFWDWTLCIAIGLVIVLILMSVIITRVANAEEIDLSIIAKIESNNNPNAVSPCGAIGTYQIMPCVLQEWNTIFKETRGIQDLFYHDFNQRVAYWYMNEKIPRYLAWYRLEDTIDARLACYNAGIGTYVKYKQGKKKLPKETQDYIKKYHKLAKDR